MTEARVRRAFSVAVYARRGASVLVIEHRRLQTWLPIGGELVSGRARLDGLDPASEQVIAAFRQ